MQGDDGAEAGSPIIAKQALSKDLEYFGLINKYKSAEEPERHRLIKKVRRAQLRTSSDEFGGDDDREFSGSATGAASTRHDMCNLTVADSDSEQELNSNPDDAEERKRKLREKRAIWESTLPKTTVQLDLEPTAKSKYTFIESDETPTRTYEQRYFDRKQNKSAIRQKIPFC